MIFSPFRWMKKNPAVFCGELNAKNFKIIIESNKIIEIFVKKGYNE